MERAVSHASCLGQLVPKLVPKPETKVEVHADASGCALSPQGGLESLQYNPTIAREEADASTNSEPSHGIGTPTWLKCSVLKLSHGQFVLSGDCLLSSTIWRIGG